MGLAALPASSERQPGEAAAMADIRIAWITVDGEECEEVWPTVERFRAWALAESLHCTWRAYAPDDGEWVCIDEGKL